MVCDWLGAVGEAEILQSVEEKRGAVIESGDGHLQTHGPQLAGLYLPRQTLQRRADKQGHNLHAGSRCVETNKKTKTAAKTFLGKTMIAE